MKAMYIAKTQSSEFLIVMGGLARETGSQEEVSRIDS
jgi:hypothetical protein